MDIEDITEEEMEIIQKYYRYLSDLSKKDKNLKISHSIDQANKTHKFKNNKAKSTAKVKPTAKTKTTVKPSPKKSTNQ